MNRMQIIRSHLSNNGIRWTVYFTIHGLIVRIGRMIARHMRSLEIKRKLPGDNTIARNYAAWQEWNWDHKGEEWTPSLEWKQSLIDEVLLRYIEPGKTVVEIGPGAGRWTEPLQKIARRLVIVDLSERCIELCKQRFAGCDNTEFYVNDGRNLSFLSSDSLEFIWSFDVFVHINVWDTEEYVKEFSRILRNGGRGVVHHPKEGRPYEDKGWRSNTTAKLFSEMLERHGLKLIQQFDSWGASGRFNVKHFNDTISVFEK